jgi:hypothetical protein
LIILLSPLIAIVIAIFVSWLVWRLYHTPLFATTLIFITFLVETLMAASNSLMVTGFNIFLPDLVFTPIAIATFFRIFNAGFFRPLTLAWLFWGAFLFVNFFIGLSIYGKTSGVEFREYFYFWSGCLYFMSFPLNKLPFIKIGQHWIKLSILISIIAIIRWITDAAGLSDWSVVGAGVPFRVLTASQALFLSYGLLILIGASLAGIDLKSPRILKPLFFITILLLQHRSVWLSTFAGIGVLYFAVQKKITNKLGTIAGIAAIMMVIGIFMTTTDFGQKAMAAVEESGIAAANGEGTVAARAYSWGQLMNQWKTAGLRIQLIGFPFGTKHSRYESDLSTEAVEYAPHNYYLQTLLRSGLIGLAAFLFVCIKTVFGLWRISSRHTPLSGYSGIFLALFLAEIIYFVPYGAGYEQSIIFGLALNLAFRVSLPRQWDRVDARHSLTPSATPG